jgi:hypothetical protein
MIHYYDDGTWDQPELAILINMERSDVTFTLPEGRTWARLVDTQSWFDSDTFLAANSLDTRTSWNATLTTPETVGATYTVPGSSIVILEEQR